MFTDDLDSTIHQKTRLLIMSHLAAVGESEFLTIKNTLGLTDGNISIHSSILEKSGYVECTKDFVGKKPRTTYRITPAGREAFAKYVTALGEILKSAGG